MADALDTTGTQSLETTTPGATTDAGAGGAPAAVAADAGAGASGDAAAGGGVDGGAGAPGAAADPLDAPSVLDADGKPGDDAGEEGKDGASADGEGGEGTGGSEERADVLLVGDVPETYEVKPPEGFKLDAKAMELFDPVFRKLTLTNDGAQELVNAAPGFVEHIRNEVAGGVISDVVAQRAAWAKAAETDPEIGGARFEESKALAAKAFDRLGLVPEGPFRTLLKESGLGNHPDMIRAMVKMGRAIGEDGFERGEAGKSDVPIWDRVYGAPVSPN